VTTGRAGKFTIDKVAKALIEAKGLRSHAAKMLGCVTSTVTNYIERSKELQEIERDLLDEQLDFCHSQLLENIKQGKEPSLFFFLKCKGAHRGWQEKQIIEGPDGGPVQTLVKILTPKAVKDMSDEEIEDFVRGECGSVAR
jgi:predicted transcriptional regulator